MPSSADSTVLVQLSNVQAKVLRAACRDQEGTADTQLLHTAASGCAELMSSDLRLFKACPELQSASSASSSCGPLSLSDVMGSQQCYSGASSAAVRPDGAPVKDSQAWFRQSNGLKLALEDYMHAEEGFGQAHTEVSAALAVQICQGKSWTFSCLPGYCVHHDNVMPTCRLSSGGPQLLLLLRVQHWGRM